MARPIEYLPDGARRVLVAANPNSGSGAHRSAVQELIDVLQQAGWVPEMVADLTRLATLPAQPVEAGYRALVAAGGDGTVAAVLNRVPADMPLAVLPLGTENLAAKYFQMLTTPLELGQIISHGATVRLDTGQANGTTFQLMASCGFDADVVERLHRTRSGHIHHLSYVKPILASIRRYQYPQLRVHYVCPSVGGSAATGTFTARWLFVVNLPRYAGGLRFVPHAVGTDGVLDVCAFEHGSLAAGLRYLYGVAGGQHGTWPDCRLLQVTRLRIEADQSVPYQLDGDPGGQLPLEIDVQPQRARWLVSERWAIAHGFRHRAR